MSPVVRPTEAADLESITAIYAEAVAHGTASFELVAPDVADMRGRLRTLATQVGWKHDKWLDTVFMQLALGEGDG